MHELQSRPSASSVPSVQKQAERLGLLLVISVVVTIVLYVVPHLRVVAYPLILLSTFAHEMGHGIAALLVGGEFRSLVMSSDASGYALMALPASRMAAAISCAGGLLGPAVAASILLVLGTRRRLAPYVVWAMSMISVVVIFWVVRSWFGVAFIGVFALICAIIAKWTKPIFQQFWIIFIATQLGLSVFSRGDYLFTPYAQTAQGKMPSDVAQIAQALFLPYWFWGALIAAINALILYAAFRLYLSQIERLDRG